MLPSITGAAPSPSSLMTEPGHHGPPPPRAGVCETHTAIVFFAGDRAYKVKKPVDLGFLD